jgi:serine/threonine protein kinase
MYSYPIDMWTVGNVIAQFGSPAMRPILPGDSEVDELFKIFQLLGTPDEECWPGVTSLPAWNASFPVWPQRVLSQFVPHLSDSAIDMLEKILVQDPNLRLSARQCLRHEYFADHVVAKDSEEDIPSHSTVPSA